MSFTDLLDRIATIEHRSQTGALDEYKVPTWETTDTSDVPCYLEQTKETEVTVDRETQVATHLLILDPDVSLDGSDEVTIEGIRYEVIGPPRFVDNPRVDALHHVEADVREIDAREESS